MNVLIVEVDPEFGRFVKGLVEGWGHAAELCGHGRNALQVFRHGVFDLVLLDVGPPNENADRLIRQLKGILPETLIVVMTDHNSYEMEVRIRELGILYYLIKSLEIEHLKPLLDHIARRKRNAHRKSTAKLRLNADGESKSHHPRMSALAIPRSYSAPHSGRAGSCETAKIDPNDLLRPQKTPFREQEIRKMNVEPNDSTQTDSGMETMGICSTCEHMSTCMLRRNNKKPVLFCEEFQPAGNPWPPSRRGETTHGGGAMRSGSSYLGLCRTCRKLSSCPFAKPGGGTWHCTDYEKEE